MNESINVKEAYIAMFSFLEELYARYEFDQLGGILGSLSMLPDGSPADQAMWDDWLKCVESSRKGSVDASLRLESTTNNPSVEPLRADHRVLVVEPQTFPHRQCVRNLA